MTRSRLAFYRITHNDLDLHKIHDLQILRARAEKTLGHLDAVSPTLTGGNDIGMDAFYQHRFLTACKPVEILEEYFIRKGYGHGYPGYSSSKMALKKSRSRHRHFEIGQYLKRIDFLISYREKTLALRQKVTALIGQQSASNTLLQGDLTQKQDTVKVDREPENRVNQEKAKLPENHEAKEIVIQQKTDQKADKQDPDVYIPGVKASKKPAHMLDELRDREDWTVVEATKDGCLAVVDGSKDALQKSSRICNEGDDGVEWDFCH